MSYLFSTILIIVIILCFYQLSRPNSNQREINKVTEHYYNQKERFNNALLLEKYAEHFQNEEENEEENNNEFEDSIQPMEKIDINSYENFFDKNNNNIVENFTTKETYSTGLNEYEYYDGINGFNGRGIGGVSGDGADNMKFLGKFESVNDKTRNGTTGAEQCAAECDKRDDCNGFIWHGDAINEVWKNTCFSSGTHSETDLLNYAEKYPRKGTQTWIKRPNDKCVKHGLELDNWKKHPTKWPNECIAELGKKCCNKDTSTGKEKCAVGIGGYNEIQLKGWLKDCETSPKFDTRNVTYYKNPYPTNWRLSGEPNLEWKSQPFKKHFDKLVAENLINDVNHTEGSNGVVINNPGWSNNAKISNNTIAVVNYWIKYIPESKWALFKNETLKIGFNYDKNVIKNLVSNPPPIDRNTQPKIDDWILVIKVGKEPGLKEEKYTKDYAGPLPESVTKLIPTNDNINLSNALPIYKSSGIMTASETATYEFKLTPSTKDVAGKQVTNPSYIFIKPISDITDIAKSKLECKNCKDIYSFPMVKDRSYEIVTLFTNADELCDFTWKISTADKWNSKTKGIINSDSLTETQIKELKKETLASIGNEKTQTNELQKKTDKLEDAFDAILDRTIRYLPTDKDKTQIEAEKKKREDQTNLLTKDTTTLNMVQNRLNISTDNKLKASMAYQSSINEIQIALDTINNLNTDISKSTAKKEQINGQLNAARKKLEKDNAVLLSKQYAVEAKALLDLSAKLNKANDDLTLLKTKYNYQFKDIKEWDKKTGIPFEIENKHSDNVKLAKSMKDSAELLVNKRQQIIIQYDNKLKSYDKQIYNDERIRIYDTEIPKLQIQKNQATANKTPVGSIEHKITEYTKGRKTTFDENAAIIEQIKDINKKIIGLIAECGLYSNDITDNLIKYKSNEDTIGMQSKSMTTNVEQIGKKQAEFKGNEFCPDPSFVEYAKFNCKELPISKQNYPSIEERTEFCTKNPNQNALPVPGKCLNPKTMFCGDNEYKEFDPAGCNNPSDPNNCILNQKNDYYHNKSYCNVPKTRFCFDPEYFEFNKNGCACKDDRGNPIECTNAGQCLSNLHSDFYPDINQCKIRRYCADNDYGEFNKPEGCKSTDRNSCLSGNYDNPGFRHDPKKCINKQFTRFCPKPDYTGFNSNPETSGCYEHTTYDRCKQTIKDKFRPDESVEYCKTMKIPFCPHPDYKEFNPNACTDKTSLQTCKLTSLQNYRPDGRIPDEPLLPDLPNKPPRPPPSAEWTNKYGDYACKTLKNVPFCADPSFFEFDPEGCKNKPTTLTACMNNIADGYMPYDKSPYCKTKLRQNI